MRIEIIGLPGVGKTHIYNLVCKRHSDSFKYFSNNVKSVRLDSLYDYLFYFKHPILVFLSNFEKKRDDLFISFKRIARRRKYILRKNDCVFTDFGIVQPLLEAHILSDTFNERINWVKLFDEIRMDHCYFIINDTINNIVKREFTRTHRRFDYNKEHLTRKYCKCDELIEILKKRMFYYEFKISDYKEASDLADDLYSKMIEVLDL